MSINQRRKQRAQISTSGSSGIGALLVTQLIAIVFSGCTECRLENPRARLYSGSRLTAGGAVISGEIARCRGPALVSFTAATEAQNKWSPAPELIIHYAPVVEKDAASINTIEIHRPSRSILLSAAVLGEAEWHHEIAHLAMSGTRPRDEIPARLIAAVEEGLADHAAAVKIGSPKLPERDLRAAPRPNWESLAFSPFDPHLLGWSFAAKLWSVRRDAPLLCLRDVPSTASTAKSAIETVIAACEPETDREILAAALEAWLPSELR